MENDKSESNPDSETECSVAPAMTTSQAELSRDEAVSPRVYLCQKLPPELERELNEDEEIKINCIREIRTWITENEEFYGRTDESFILRYLRVCKFNLEKTKQRILKSYKIRHSYAKYFTWANGNAEMVEELIAQGFAYNMDYAGSSRQSVGIVCGSGLNLDKYSMDASVCTILALVNEVAYEDPRLQVCGLSIIYDPTGLSLAAILQLTPTMIWRAVNLLTVSAPLKINAMHFVNMPDFFKNVLNLLKTFLSKKLKSRVFVHKDFESLHEFVPPECLPFEYGGTAGPRKFFQDESAKQFRYSREVSEKNQLYGIGKQPLQLIESTAVA